MPSFKGISITLSKIVDHGTPKHYEALVKFVKIKRINNQWVEVITPPDYDYADALKMIYNLSAGVAVVCKTMPLDFWLDEGTISVLTPSMSCPFRKTLYRNVDLYIPITGMIDELIWVVGDKGNAGISSHYRSVPVAHFRLPERE